MRDCDAAGLGRRDAETPETSSRVAAMDEGEETDEEERADAALFDDERALATHVVRVTLRIASRAVGKDAKTPSRNSWRACARARGDDVDSRASDVRDARGIERRGVGVGIGDDGRVRGVEVSRVLGEEAQVDATVDE